MGFTRSKSILLLALVSFLHQSETASKKRPLQTGVEDVTSQYPVCVKGLKKSDIKTFKINGEQIRVCFDYTRQGAIWTYHEVDGKALKNPESATGRSTRWKIDGLDDDVIQTVKTSQFYRKAYKKESHGKGANEPEVYLARGHLTPNADFASREERASTFYFINAAPQWQYFNGKSWSQLENRIRNYAKSGQGKTLQVITGTDGVFKDNSGEWYLTWKMPDANNNKIKKIPVPNFFWKIVWDDAKRAGIAFIGSNHPLPKGKGPQVKGRPNTGGQYKADRCSGSYKNVNKGYIWCYTIKEIFEVLPELENYAVPLLEKKVKSLKIKDNNKFLNL